MNELSILLYPLRFLANMIRSVIAIFVLVAAVIFYSILWVVASHSDRADMTKNFVAEQAVYRVNPTETFYRDAAIVQTIGQYPLPRERQLEIFNGCVGTGEQLKKQSWLSGDWGSPRTNAIYWLNGKNDVFQSAYIASSRNLAALKVALRRSKEPFQPVDSFRNACTDAMNGKSVVIPNAPVVLVSLLNRIDDDNMNPKNWFTGMCLVGSNCTDADFVPRNDSIYVDVFYPQVTKNQGAAVKALNVTGTPEFWIAAAHANGIYGHDSEFASYAAMQKAQLAKDLYRPLKDSEEWTAEVLTALAILAILTLCLGLLANRLFLPRIKKVFTKKSANDDIYQLPKFEPKPGQPIWP